MDRGSSREWGGELLKHGMNGREVLGNGTLEAGNEWTGKVLGNGRGTLEAGNEWTGEVLGNRERNSFKAGNEWTGSSREWGGELLKHGMSGQGKF